MLWGCDSDVGAVSPRPVSPRPVLGDLSVESGVLSQVLAGAASSPHRHAQKPQAHFLVFVNPQGLG